MSRSSAFVSEDVNARMRKLEGRHGRNACGCRVIRRCGSTLCNKGHISNTPAGKRASLAQPIRRLKDLRRPSRMFAVPKVVLELANDWSAFPPLSEKQA